MLAQGVKPVELAQRLDVPRQEITRLLNSRHAMKIGAVDNALKALGKNLDLQVHLLCRSIEVHSGIRM